MKQCRSIATNAPVALRWQKHKLKIYERFDAPTFWKFYWGEDADDPNSYNFKKMDWFHLDATRNFTKEPIVKSELEQELTKARTSGNAVKDFTAMVKAKFPKPDGK